MSEKVMMRKKGQAAMEFLMTYGWAILVVLVAIGALAYFGVLSPDKFLPERCQGPPGMDCIDKATITSGAAAASQLVFVFKNNAGYQIDVMAVSKDNAGAGCTVDGPSKTTTAVDQTGGTTYVNGVKADNGAKVRVTVNCDNAIAAGRFKTDVVLDYISVETGQNHKATFTITGVAAP